MLNMELEMAEDIKRVENLDHIAGKGLFQPCLNSTSGARKNLQGVQLQQGLALYRHKSEIPIIQTGYENRFGDRSSSVLTAHGNLEVIYKISKFSVDPNHHYFLITYNNDTGLYGVIERKSYAYSTESYGYLYNNTMLDALEPGFTIPEGETLRNSFAFDEHMNRADGVNLMTAFIGTNSNQEDGIVISDVAAEKLSSPLIKKVSVIINSNDILLNLGGDPNRYKAFPDINEDIKDGILCGVRRERTENSLYSQAIERLSELFISDDKYIIKGKVIDINIYCNDYKLDNVYQNQLLAYYMDRKRFNTEIKECIDELGIEESQMEYNLQKLLFVCNQELSETSFVKDRPFTGVLLEFIIQEKNVSRKGDKFTNRFGGKGVISEVLPEEEMPIIGGKRVEVILNNATCVNRLNPGQLHEMSMNFMSASICDYIISNKIDTDTAINMIFDFIGMISQDQSEALRQYLFSGDVEDRECWLEETLASGNILLSIRPIEESISLDQLNLIYQRFPFIKQLETLSPIRGSNGVIRFVPGRRKMVASKMYFYRLKQYAKEKFSAVSLSSTNLKNENTKNKDSKNYRSLHSSTPIRFGEMENNNLNHMGTEYIIQTLMIHSLSPQARRLCEDMFTGDPYHIDIVLDKDSRNRSVEILNTYLKTMGLRLVISRKKKKTDNAFDIDAFTMENPLNSDKYAFSIVSDEEVFNPDQVYKEMIAAENIFNSQAFEIFMFSHYDRHDEEITDFVDKDLEIKGEKLSGML